MRDPPTLPGPSGLPSGKCLQASFHLENLHVHRGRMRPPELLGDRVFEALFQELLDEPDARVPLLAGARFLYSVGHGGPIGILPRKGEPRFQQNPPLVAVTGVPTAARRATIVSRFRAVHF